jgi:hypothetical protein
MSTETLAGSEIRSEQRGPHWIAWVPDSGGKPQHAIVLVGRTRDEAESRAREWREQLPGGSGRR